MHTITTQEIKRNGLNALSLGEPTFLIVNSKPKAVILSLEEFELLVSQAQELEDLKQGLESVNSAEISYADLQSLVAEKEKIEIKP